MDRSVISVPLTFIILGLLSAFVNSQGNQAGSGNLYYGLDHHDPFYSPPDFGYRQQGFKPHPDPALFSAAAYPYPNIYQYGVSNYPNPNPTSNYYAVSTSYYNNNPNSNHNSHYYNSDPYPPYSGYATATASPPVTTSSQPQPAVPSSSWRGGVGGGEEQEVDDGGSTGARTSGADVSGGGGPVFNSQVFLGPQQAFPAWPFQTMKNVNSLSGRLFLLPPAVGGQGLLEAVTNAQRHRQRSSASFRNRNNLATNPLFLLLAFNGFS